MRRPEGRWGAVGRGGREGLAQQKVRVTEKEVLNWSGMPALTFLLTRTCSQNTHTGSPPPPPPSRFSLLSFHFPLCLFLLVFSFFPLIIWLNPPALSLSLSQCIHTPAAMGNPSKSIIHASLLPAFLSFPLCRPLCVRVCVQESERET